ncbi:tRNA-splicing endonuclease subunit sen54 N-term-domain-containing protein [Irpex rosettiformis]|uniref:tRNA-splicing endonuclease subunit sen54 N-term-domain-containing protein n=1 Tax=Irpex rosettiformis TaxID=378272 RepID=A0ACB8TYB0_9APHY|nr:tRNA-splicing endonuclease subunit sen54 N-term-domain-containing protein [Irpex rosettiformis]
MDDTIEAPSFVTKATLSGERREDDEQSSGDEDEGPDWTKLPFIARPVIPKRGEKDFEPKVSGGSGLQRHVLDRARSAMLDALKATRTSSNKTVSHAVWHSDIARAHVTAARGIHFSTMGHSVSRPNLKESEGLQRAHKRLELLPEEALYLVERGSLFCWKPAETIPISSPGLEDIEGSPMTVQQAFAEMIGKEDLTLERYQVYSYLRRLGYAVTRTVPPSKEYPAAAPFPLRQVQGAVGIWTRISRLLAWPFVRISQLFSRSFDWWRPIYIRRWLLCNLSYVSVFKSLRFLPSGYSVPLHVKPPETPSSYQIFYNLYKPSTPFKKTAPPAPDFSIVVINARTTPVPSLSQLNELFDILPELPPPVPRRRTLLAGKPVPPSALSAPSTTPAVKPSLLRQLSPWTWWSTTPSSPKTAPRKPNPFAILKSGKKMVVVAAVDAGMISFFRFGQGAFEDFPMN